LQYLQSDLCRESQLWKPVLTYGFVKIKSGNNLPQLRSDGVVTH